MFVTEKRFKVLEDRVEELEQELFGKTNLLRYECGKQAWNPVKDVIEAILEHLGYDVYVTSPVASKLILKPGKRNSNPEPKV